jgi:hypothetical protein
MATISPNGCGFFPAGGGRRSLPRGSVRRTGPDDVALAGLDNPDASGSSRLAGGAERDTPEGDAPRDMDCVGAHARR